MTRFGSLKPATLLCVAITLAACSAAPSRLPDQAPSPGPGEAVPSEPAGTPAAATPGADSTAAEATPAEATPAAPSGEPVPTVLEIDEGVLPRAFSYGIPIWEITSAVIMTRIRAVRAR